MKALHKTRGLLRLRSWVLGVAIFFTLAPLARYDVSFDRDPGVVSLLGQRPDLAALAGAIAIVAWAGYFMLRRRLAVTSL